MRSADMAAKTVFDGRITKAALKRLAGERYFQRGVSYFEDGAVVGLRHGTDGISARVQGTEPYPYAVRFWIEDGKLTWGCTCPLGLDAAFCKHLVAVGVAWAEGERAIHDAAPHDVQEVDDIVDRIDSSALIRILSERLMWDEGLLAEFALAARAARQEGGVKSVTKGRRRRSRSRNSKT